MEKSPERVLWTQGMLLMPQHLQQHDLYQEQARELRLRAIAPDAWGIQQVAFDHDALHQGQLTLRALQAVFPSGLCIGLGATTSGEDLKTPALQRALEGAPIGAHQAARVFVAVARLQEGAANVAIDTPARTHQRFVARRRLVAEHSHGTTAAIEVAFAAPHVQLLWENELRGEMEALCVGEVQRRADGQLGFAIDYVPPCLWIGASPYVMQRLQQLLGQLRARHRHLTALCAHRRGASHPVHVADLLHFEQLAASRTALAWLHELVAEPYTSPKAAARMLSQAIAALGAFGVGEEPEPLPPATMHDLRAFFGAAFERIEGLLATDAQSAHEQHLLHLGPDGWWLAEEIGALASDGGACFLAVSGSALLAEGAERWARFARVASVSELPHLIRVAALGVPLKAVSRPPDNVPWDPDTLYFALDTTHRAWQDVVRERTLGVAPPPGLRGGDITALRVLVVPGATP